MQHKRTDAVFQLQEPSARDRGETVTDGHNQKGRLHSLRVSWFAGYFVISI